MKTKVLISCAVTAQLICTFVFAYAFCWFSGAAAHIQSHIPMLNSPQLDESSFFCFFAGATFSLFSAAGDPGNVSNFNRLCGNNKVMLVQHSHCFLLLGNLEMYQILTEYVEIIKSCWSHILIVFCCWGTWKCIKF